ncbi:MAG: ABC transporter ATP-binding protein [Deltaproteobacteria bacterium]|nr:ABC transporter ATP-binding protein [Deltaproteobacteria bacterium]
MAAIRTSGLTKRYPSQARAGQPPALSDLSLHVADGELLVLVGPSGCGKSTVLRLIAGLELPDAGTIQLGERDLAGVPPQERDVAMVFQGYALYPHLSARDNIAFPLKMRGISRAERARRVAAVADTLGLGELLDRRPAELSGGERQRVAMGRAIVRSPQAFLFDEPLSNLDAKLRAELRTELAALVRGLGATALYVTHDQAEAMTMGDRVAVLRRGALQQVGTPREIYEDPASSFVAGFLGTPAINLIELACDGPSARVPGLTLPVPPALAGRRRLCAGVRPEHVQLGPSHGGGPATIRAAAQVVAVEPLGAESFLHLDAQGTALRARLAGLDTPRPGDPVEIALSCDRILWFDAETCGRLRAGEGK